MSFRGLHPEGIDKLVALQVLIWLGRTLCWQDSVFKLNLTSYKVFMLWLERSSYSFSKILTKSCILKNANKQDKWNKAYGNCLTSTIDCPV